MHVFLCFEPFLLSNSEALSLFFFVQQMSDFKILAQLNFE